MEAAQEYNRLQCVLDDVQAMAQFKLLNHGLRPVRGIVQPPVLPSAKPHQKTKQLKFLLAVMKTLGKCQDSWPFKIPVDALKLNLPDYHGIIKYAMDFRTINKRLENGYYSSADECIRDIRIIFFNCYKFNHKVTDVYGMAETVEKIFNSEMRKFPNEEIKTVSFGVMNSGNKGVGRPKGVEGQTPVFASKPTAAVSEKRSVPKVSTSQPAPTPPPKRKTESASVPCSTNMPTASSEMSVSLTKAGPVANNIKSYHIPKKIVASKPTAAVSEKRSVPKVSTSQPAPTPPPKRKTESASVPCSTNMPTASSEMSVSLTKAGPVTNNIKSYHIPKKIVASKPTAAVSEKRSVPKVSTSQPAPTPPPKRKTESASVPCSTNMPTASSEMSVSLTKAGPVANNIKSYHIPKKIVATHLSKPVNIKLKKNEIEQMNTVQLNYCKEIVNELSCKMQQVYACAFYNAAKVASFEHNAYLNFVKTPMDLKTVEVKLKNQDYQNHADFASDVRLIFSNCYRHCNPDDEIFLFARGFQGVFEIRYANISGEPVRNDPVSQPITKKVYSSLEFSKRSSIDFKDKKEGQMEPHLHKENERFAELNILQENFQRNGKRKRNSEQVKNETRGNNNAKQMSYDRRGVYLESTQHSGKVERETKRQKIENSWQDHSGQLHNNSKKADSRNFKVSRLTDSSSSSSEASDSETGGKFH